LPRVPGGYRQKRAREFASASEITASVRPLPSPRSTNSSSRGWKTV